MAIDPVSGIDPTTRIGADGKRHAADEDGHPTGPTDASLFKPFFLAVTGSPGDGQVAVKDDEGNGYHWADPGEGGDTLPEGVYVQADTPDDASDGDIWVVTT